MFINNGKSLFGNKGLIISILILIILLYFSYNKCYKNNSINTIIDNFVVSKNIEPTDVRINIDKNSVVVKFSIDNSKTNELPQSFMIVLAQYDSNKNNTGNNTFYLSNETILNPLKKNNDDTNGKKNHTCNIVNGSPECQYIFSNIYAKDKNNNVYYYKVGVSAIYANGDSPFVTPYNVSSTDKMFTLITSLDNQNSNKEECSTDISADIYNKTISTSDGQYELIKSQLGNYPDGLILDTQTVNNNSLSDLLDKSMAQALLNVNVST